MLNSCCGSPDQLCKVFPNDVSEITPHSASREVEEESVIVKHGQFRYVRSFFPGSVSRPRLDDASRRGAGGEGGEGYGAGDLKYGHVDAKNIGARYIQFIRRILSPTRRAHRLHRT